MQGVQSLSRLLPHGKFRARVLQAMIRHHWFIRMRWVIVLATAALLVIEWLQMPGLRRPSAVALAVSWLAIINLVWMLVGRGLLVAGGEGDTIAPGVLRRVTVFTNAQMMVDLLFLTIILRYTGGIENPMAIFYLFHVLIATLLLTSANALLQGFWALLLYSVLAVGECCGFIRPHYPFMASMAESKLYLDWVYVLTSVGVLAAGVFGTAYFTQQISSRLDDQEGELYEANNALRRSQVAIQDLQARRSRFMLTAAHQLKGPLAGIETLAGLIRDRVVGADALDGVVTRIVSRCQQAIVQVTELLTLARVQEAAPLKHQAADTPVAEVLGKVVRSFSELAAYKRIDLQFSLELGEGALAAVDSRDLEDCISNLVDNAIKYTPEGGKVWVRASRDHETISISVKDNGMGIAEDSEDDLFDPFRRGNLALAASIPGSGLGLAIVREVVEQAGGRIEVRSAAGEGSEFTLVLPTHDAPVAAVRGTRTTIMSSHASPAE